MGGFPGEDAEDMLIDDGFRDYSLLDGGVNLFEASRIISRNDEVVTGEDSLSSGVGNVFGSTHGEVVGNDNSLEAEVAAKETVDWRRE